MVGYYIGVLGEDLGTESSVLGGIVMTVVVMMMMLMIMRGGVWDGY